MIEPLETRIAPAALVNAFRLSNGLAPDGSQTPSVVTTDSAGDIIVAGRFYGGFETDVVPAADPLDGDIYVAKYKPTGERVWVRKWGGIGEETPRAIVVNAQNDIFVAGGFASVGANFDGPGGGISAQGREDAFVFKLKADGTADTTFGTFGNLRWGGAGTEFFERANSLVVDSAGAVLVAGLFSSPDAGFSASPTVAALAIDGFILKVNGTTGAPITTFGGSGMIRFGGPGFDGFSRVVVDANDDVFVAAVENVAGVGEFSEVLKFTGADGNRATSFGGNGAVGIVPPHPPSSFTTVDIRMDYANRLVAVGGQSATTTAVIRIDPVSGVPDPTFSAGNPVLVPFSPADEVRLNIDHQNNIYFSGNEAATSEAYVFRISNSGYVYGIDLFTKTRALYEVLDANDNLILRGTYTGSPDLDGTNGVLKLAARSAAKLGANTSEGYVVVIDPYGVDKSNPLTYNDGAGNAVTISLSGAGRAQYLLAGGELDNAPLDTLALIDTDLTTKVAMKVGTGGGTTSVMRIVTKGAQQDVGSITLGSNVVLGIEPQESLGELTVTGRLNQLVLGDIVENSIIALGRGLPYNLPGTAASDTYNNRPSLTIGNVLGPGVQINVIGDGVTPMGTGGGGLGDVVIGSWKFPGFLRTTQSIGDFTVLKEDFYGVLEVDKFHLGEGTEANCGDMTIQDGGWGSSGSEIEGTVESFNAEEFLAGATLTAGSIGLVTVDGDFDGVIILTDPDSPAIPTFTVNTDFTGVVISASPVKKLKVKGDFKGSLEAPLIGSITAYSFLGSVDLMDQPTTYIKATAGGLGTLTTTAGAVSNYALVTTQVFKGFKVNLSKLSTDTVGIDNVQITAASIGNTSVTLKAASTATDLDLIGIRNTTFATTATGDTKATAGSIGSITVTLVGAAGGTSAIGIQNSSFSALAGTLLAPDSSINSLGKISVKISGQSGANLGLDQVSFTGNSIGAVAVNVSRPSNPALTSTARAIDSASFTATGAIGAVSVSGDATTPAVDGLQILAGGNVGNVSVKTKTAANGTLLNSAILAGQLLVLDGMTAAEQTAKLGAAKLGNVSVSGSLTNTDLVAGATIGGVTVGGSMSDSLVLAGATLGGDLALDGDEVYHRVATITSVSVKGLFERTSLIAGVIPGDFIFGNNDDTLAAEVNWLASSSRIGQISLSAGPTGTPSGSHDYAIAAGALTGLKLGGISITGFPLYLDLGSLGEEPADVIVRTYS